MAYVIMVLNAARDWYWSGTDWVADEGRAQKFMTRLEAEAVRKGDRLSSSFEETSIVVALEPKEGD